MLTVRIFLAHLTVTCMQLLTQLCGVGKTMLIVAGFDSVVLIVGCLIQHISSSIFTLLYWKMQAGRKDKRGSRVLATIE
jgi:hypothetical protein